MNKSSQIVKMSALASKNGLYIFANFGKYKMMHPSTNE